MNDNEVREEMAKIMRPKTSKSFVNFAKLKERHSVNQVRLGSNFILIIVKPKYSRILFIGWFTSN